MAISDYTDLSPYAIFDARKGVQGDYVPTEISAISQAADATFTSTAHGLTQGQTAALSVTNCSPVADGTKTIGVVTANTFKLNPAHDTSAGAAGTFGKVAGIGFIPALDGRRVAKWLTQVAGKTADILQATASNSPTYFGGARHGLGPAVNFLPNINDTGVNANLGHVAVGGGSQYLRSSFLAGTAPTMGTLSLLAVLTPFNSLDGSDPASAATADLFGSIFNISTTSYQGVGIWKNKLCLYSSVGKASAGKLPNDASTPLPIIDSGLYVPNTPCVIAVSAGATNVTFRVNGKSVTVPNTFAGDSAGTKILSMGVADGGAYPYWGKVHEVVVTTGEWTSTQLDDGVAFAQADWGIAPVQRLNMVHIADSIGSGKYASGMNGAAAWPHILDSMISPKGCGHSSFIMAYAAKTAVLTDTEYASRVHPVFQSDMANVACIMLGINDMVASASAATVAAAIFSVCDKARASGARYVLLFGLLPGVTVAGAASGEDNTEVVRLAVNALLAAGYASHADAYIPLDSLVAPTLEFTTMKLRLHGDTSIMLSEGTAFVHPQAVLQEQIARKAYAVLRPLLSSINGVPSFGTLTQSRFFRG